MNRLSFSYGFIQKIAVLYLVVWSIAPLMSIDTIYRIAALGAVFVWLVCAFFRKIEFNRSQVIAFFFIAAVALINLIQYNGFSGFFKPISYYMLGLFFIMSGFYSDKLDELKFLIPVTLFLLIIFNIRSAQAVISDPTIARLIVRNDEEIYTYLRQGVGGYALIYLQVIAFPAILSYILKCFKVNLLNFIFGCVWLVSYIVFIANAGYSLAIVSTLISTVVLLFYRGKSVVPAIVVSLALFIGVMMLLLYSEGIRNALLNFFDGTAVAKKINDLVATSEGTASDNSSIAVRISAYRNSIEAIFKNFLIGDLWRNQNYGGGHSAILDSFAKYGLVGGFIYSKMFFSSPNNYKKRHIDSVLVRSFCNATIVSLAFVGILDSITYEIIAMVLIMIPVFYHCTFEMSNNNYDTVMQKR